MTCEVMMEEIRNHAGEPAKGNCIFKSSYKVSVLIARFPSAGLMGELQRPQTSHFGFTLLVNTNILTTTTTNTKIKKNKKKRKEKV